MLYLGLQISLFGSLHPKKFLALPGQANSKGGALIGFGLFYKQLSFMVLLHNSFT